MAHGQGAAAAAVAAPRPVEDFAVLPFMEDPKLSPDGSKVAAKIAIHGEQYFAIMPLFGGVPPALVRSAGQDINWWRWVSDSWLVVGIGAMDTVEGTDIYLRRAIGVAADGKKIVPLLFHEAAQGGDDVIWVATDGTPRVRLALQKSVYLSSPDFWPQVVEVDVSTGKSRSVVKPVADVTDWYADGTGAVRIGIGRRNEGRSVRLLYRDSDESGFRTVDRADYRKGEDLTVPALFLAEPGQALAIDDSGGYDAVHKLDLATLKIGEKVFGVDGYDIDGIIADRAAGKLLGIAYTDNGPAVRWLDPDLAAAQDAIDKAVPGRRASIVSMNRDRQRLLIHLGSASQPGAYYFMDLADGRMQRIAYVNERIGSASLNPVRTIRYKARDGLEIAAILTLPAQRPAKSLPVIVMPHGGPFARDGEQWDWWSQFLASRGYAVIQPNFRGSSGYGSAFARKGKGQWGLAMQDDVDDALAELGRLGIADTKRAAIVGGSYGGYAALRAAQRNGALYRCAVSFAGVSDLAALLRYDREFLNSGSARDWLKTQAPDVAGVSPINFPAQFSIPVLLVHGKADRRVPVKQSREMAEKLRAAGKDFKYVEQPLGDHFLSREADRVAFLQGLEDFLKQHNPA
ncbi:MAG: alpha/beta hydrolase family protein [Allosphingosinicella sp.]